MVRRLVPIVVIICVFSSVGAKAGRSEKSSVFQQDFQICSTDVTTTEEHQLRVDEGRYERTIEALQAKSKTPAIVDSETATATESQLRQTQTNLLRVIERLECKHLSQLNDPVVRGPAEPKPNFVEIHINFATDRLANSVQVTSPKPDPSKYFSGILDPDFKDFSFGTVTVTIPTRRLPGELNLPSFWNFVRQPDPERFFVIQQVSSTNRDEFMKQMNDVGPNKESSLLLFVHGFDTTFADAAFRAAQLAHDLQFPGKVMFYSWPSAGDVTSYWKDEDSSRISASRFQKLLADLIATKINRIYVVSHSMGSRIVIPSINGLASRGADVSKISELVLAAPDFNEIEFKDVAAAFRDLRAKGTRVTIYASSNDFALRVSRIIHSYRRLGESQPALDVFPGLDSVDASGVASIRRAFGHSYVYDSAAVIGDMEDIVLKSLPPKDRGLVGVPDTQFGWKFPK